MVNLCAVIDFLSMCQLELVDQCRMADAFRFELPEVGLYGCFDCVIIQLICRLNRPACSCQVSKDVFAVVGAEIPVICLQKMDRQDSVVESRSDVIQERTGFFFIS